jgi:uncharacterized membrane protein
MVTCPRGPEPKSLFAKGARFIEHANEIEICCTWLTGPEWGICPTACAVRPRLGSRRWRDRRVLSSWQAAALLGWDGAAILFAARVWVTVLPMSPTQCSDHSIREDPSRAVADSVVLVAAVANLASVGLILVKAANAMGGTKAYLLTVGMVSVVLAWGVVHTIFTLRYARIYYTGPDGGVDFNEKTPPDYTDFAYLAFTIGMTFQVSDTNLTSKAMRRTACAMP